MANISQVKLPSGVTYPLKAPVIPYGTVDSTSTATAFTATVDGITELTDGTIMMLHNGTVTSASGFTINVNGLGAKKVYNNLTNATQDTTIFNIAYTMIFVYSTALDSGNGGWWCYRGYDSNTNTIGYQLRGNSGTRPATDKGYKYRLWLTSADDQGWVPINISTSTNATTARTLNTRAIDPFGEIVYNSLNGTTNAGDNVGANTTWQQYTLNIGYSYVKTLTADDPVYLKCTPQTTGGAVMNDIVQKLPTTKDGFIYIYLGIAYSTTSMELRFYHPVYYHDGTGVRIWTGKETSTVSYSQNVISGTKIGTITIDGTGTDIYAPSAGGGGTITAVKTTAGAHTTINVTSGNAEFNVPTKTSHLTNDRGYITGITSSDVITALGYTPYNSTNPSGYTSNTGTVESVAISNATNGGLSVAGSPITSSGTISIGHSNVLSAAQTTQAVYPIAIDKNGHVSSYGSAVTITDEKLKVSSASSGTTYYPVLSASGTTASTKWIDSGLSYSFTGSSASLYVGDDSSRYGWIYIGDGSYKVGIASAVLSADRTITLPDASGTVALTSDITTATLSATDDGDGNVTLSVSGVTSANLNSASGVSF